MSCCRALSRFRIKQIKRERWGSLYGSISRSANTQTCRWSAPSTGKVGTHKTPRHFSICVVDMLNNAVIYFLTLIVMLLNCLSAFLRGSPWVVPHSSRQEGSTETGASLLQERRAWGRQSRTAGLPGKVTKERSSTQISISHDYFSRLSQTFCTPPLSAPDFRVISASQTPCRSWWTRAKLPLSPPASLSSQGLLSWPLTLTCSVTKKPQLMWVRRGQLMLIFPKSSAHDLHY